PVDLTNLTTQNIPVNVQKWERSPSECDQNPCIVEVVFDGSNPRKWESPTIPPRRVKNAERRSREYLTPTEVEKLTKAAERLGRHGHRDATIIMIAFRHALRVAELCALRWDQIDLAQGLMHVRRVKNGAPSSHPLHGPELR